MSSKAGVTYSYADTAHKHAVTALSNGSSFTYDANGNMTSRVEVTGTRRITYTQVWSVDNRLVEVVSGTQHTQFFYDVDGTLVRKVDPRGTTAYIGADDEITWLALTQTITVPVNYTHTLYLPMMAASQINPSSGVSTTYYRFNGGRVVMRSGSNVYWISGDHLGSASLTTSITGTKLSELRYTPYGETRYTSGDTLTNKRFTSQEEQAGIGLYNYGARFYDPRIGRFLSADTIVPGAKNPQALNRYSYVENTPLKFTDPTGHDVNCAGDDYACKGQVDTERQAEFIRQRIEYLDRERERCSNGGANCPNYPEILGFSALALGGIVLFPEGVAAAADGVKGIGTAVGAGLTNLATQVAANCLTNGFCAKLFGYGEGANSQVIQVFRVEGNANTRILIGEGGNVEISGGSRMLFLNFGDEARAVEFFAKRVNQGMDGLSIKSFEVQSSFVEKLRVDAVPEEFARVFPNAPLVVDVTKAMDQYGLRLDQIEELISAIIQGSGKVGP